MDFGALTVYDNAMYGLPLSRDLIFRLYDISPEM
jgi:hypothetical protein